MCEVKPMRKGMIVFKRVWEKSSHVEVEFQIGRQRGGVGQLVMQLSPKLFERVR